MVPVDFPEANATFGPPAGLTESQVQSIQAYVGQVERGSVEGVSMVVLAWKPTLQEIEVIKRGGIIFLTVLGRCPPHYLSTNFHDATHPA